MGADKAIHVEIPAKEYETTQPFHISKILALIAQKEAVNLVIMGKQASGLWGSEGSCGGVISLNFQFFLFLFFMFNSFSFF